MTAEEMIIEVYENSTENTELNPYTNGVFDINSAGAQKCLGYLNRGYGVICTWKDSKNRRIRFNELHKIINFKTTLLEGFIASGYAGSVEISGLSTADNFYVDWCIKITSGTGSGQIRGIMSSIGSTGILNVNRDWGTIPDNTSEYQLYKRIYSLNDIGMEGTQKVYGILKVLNMKDKVELGYGSRTESFIENTESAQIPTAYIFERNTLIFNYGINEKVWFSIEYFAYPDVLVNEGDIPVIPESFHDVVVMYAGWINSKKNGDQETAVSEYRNMVGLLNRLVTDEDVLQDRINNGLYMEVSE